MSDENDNLDNGTPSADSTQDAPPQDTPPPDNTATDTGGEEAGKTADSPPEPYVLDLGGFGADLPPEELKFFTEIARESGAPPEAASALIQSFGAYSKAVQDCTAKEWEDASRNDAEFGGDNFEANISIANKALKTYGSDALVEMLSTSPMGNNPEVIRFLWKVGQTLSEDRFTGGQAAQGGGFDARDFFPNSNMNP